MSVQKKQNPTAENINASVRGVSRFYSSDARVIPVNELTKPVPRTLHELLCTSSVYNPPFKCTIHDGCFVQLPFLIGLSLDHSQSGTTHQYRPRWILKLKAQMYIVCVYLR